MLEVLAQHSGQWYTSEEARELVFEDTQFSGVVLCRTAGIRVSPRAMASRLAKLHKLGLVYRDVNRRFSFKGI